MKVLVGVKRVVDYAVKVRVAADKTGVELKNVKMSMNPFCEIAIEEAARLKEAKTATEVVVMSIGPKEAQETIRTALAMGGDRGIHIKTDMRIDQDLQPLNIAKLMAKIVEEEKPDLVILGKQSIDSDACQTGQMLAALMNCGQVTFASELTFDGNNITAKRETDSGEETVSVAMPAVVTADLRLNIPRYAKLPNIMKAKKKKIDAREASEFGIDLEPRIITTNVEDPPARDAGIKVDDVDSLFDKLRNAEDFPH